LLQGTFFKLEKIKHIFTGDLEANIITNPFFFGKEKHYLKAQIVRISYNTTIVPKNRFKLPEDEASRDIEINEEFSMPPFESLKNGDNWVHLYTNILLEGKLIHTEPEGAEEAQITLIKKRDPFEPMLKPIGKDKAPAGSKSAWTFKTYGDQINYDTIEAKAKKVNYGILLARSQIWPGSMTLFSHKSWSQLYVGYGFKAEVKPYFPRLVQSIQQEPVEREEQPEPNPKDAPVEVVKNEEGGNAENPENPEES